MFAPGSNNKEGSILNLGVKTLPSGIKWLISFIFLALTCSLIIQPQQTSLLLFAVVAALGFLLLSSRYPELGLLTLIAFTSSFLPADIIDLRLPVGGGFDLRDLILLALLFSAFLRQLHQPTLHKLSWHASLPLLLLLLWAVYSAFYAVFYMNVETNWVFNELRIMLYYSVFFLTALACTNRVSIVRLIWGLLILSNLTALLVIIQQFFSANGLLAALLTELEWIIWTQGQAEGFGTLRIIPPGHVLLYFLSVIAFTQLVFGEIKWKPRLFWLFQFVFLNFALIISFTRAQWLASLFALALISIILLPYYKHIFLRYSVPILAGILIFTALLGPQLSERLLASEFYMALETRVLSLFQVSATAQTYSLQWRAFENQEALKVISEQPALGVGLGNSYRDITILQGEASGRFTQAVGVSDPYRFTRYIHNSFLFLAVKLGLVGLFLFIWFVLDFLFLGFKQYRDRTDRPEERQLKGLSLAITCALSGLMLWSLFHSHLMETESTSVIGLMTGLVLSLYMQRRSFANKARAL